MYDDDFFRFFHDGACRSAAVIVPIVLITFQSAALSTSAVAKGRGCGSGRNRGPGGFAAWTARTSIAVPC